MEDRIHFTSRNGQRILLIDLSHCSAADVEKICRLVPKFVTAEPKGSVLLLADFTGAELSREAVTMLKEGTVFDRPFIKRSAWVGNRVNPKSFL